MRLSAVRDNADRLSRCSEKADSARGCETAASGALADLDPGARRSWFKADDLIPDKGQFARHEGHVGLAEHDGAGLQQSIDEKGVFGCDIILP